MNGSGFFVFNEEDMKNMTEMSPKNKTLINARSVSLQLEHHVVEGQLTHRQQPTIKAPPVLESQNTNNLVSRIRSISYQNQKAKDSVELVPLQNLRFMELINESSSSILIDDNAIEGNSPSRLTFAANPTLHKDYVSSPLSPRRKI